MSWTLQVELNHERTSLGLQKDLDALNAAAPSGNDHAIRERDEQVRAAKDAVFRILAADDGSWEGGTGPFDNAEVIKVTIAGHANKDHKKDASWADEYISIHLYVNKYRAG
jgi:hypothetical protein